MYDRYKAINKLTIFIKYCEDYMYNMITKVNMGNCFGNMFKSLLINGSTSNMIECESSINIIYVVEKMEKLR